MSLNRSQNQNKKNHTVTLVLGGARSGKSAYAESLAQKAALQDGKTVIYIATASALDDEMSARIAHHRQHRNAAWKTVEVNHQLGSAIEEWSHPNTIVIVDCLTLWLTQLMFMNVDGKPKDHPDVGSCALEPHFFFERQDLLDTLQKTQGEIILISNEVGLGLVPMGAINRAFVDEAGRLNQAVAVLCDRVIFVAAGLPLVLKDGSSNQTNFASAKLAKT